MEVITRVGYCDFDHLAQYRLDDETALVLASAVQIESLGSDSTESGTNCVVTVEHMQKLSDHDMRALALSMNLEWKSIMTPNYYETQKRSSCEPVYRTPESAKKVRRLVSEPKSPAHPK